MNTAPSSASATRAFLRDLRSRKVALVSFTVLLILVAASIAVIPLADLTAKQDIGMRLQPPAWLPGDGTTWLGTDQLGRDLGLRLMAGIRTSLTVGVLAVVLGFVLGTAAGVCAGFYRGWPDRILGVTADVQLSFPSLLVAMLLVRVLGGGVTTLVLIFGFTSWMLYMRMARSLTLTICQASYMDAARAIGAGGVRQVFSHVLPNILPSMVGIGLLEIARLVLAESSMSFLGLGLSPPAVSLGIVLADGRGYLEGAWWISTFAGAVLLLLVLSVTLSGRWLQERSDPLGR